MCACTAKRLLISFCCLLHHNACTSLFVTLTLPIDCIRPLCVCLQLPMPAHFFSFCSYATNFSISFFYVTAHYSLCLFAPFPMRCNMSAAYLILLFVHHNVCTSLIVILTLPIDVILTQRHNACAFLFVCKLTILCVTYCKSPVCVSLPPHQMTS